MKQIASVFNSDTLLINVESKSNAFKSGSTCYDKNVYADREIGVETVEDTAASNIIKKLFCWKKICQKSRTVELSIVHMDLSINLRCL